MSKEMRKTDFKAQSLRSPKIDVDEIVEAVPTANFA